MKQFRYKYKLKYLDIKSNGTINELIYVFPRLEINEAYAHTDIHRYTYTQ